MKKFLVSLICLLTLSAMNVKGVELPEVTDHEKVTIYIFRGNGCGFCKKALTYFNEVKNEYADYFEVKTYEVWENQYNNELMNDVADKLGDTLEGVPYIVVGQTSVNGFNDELSEKIVNAALTEYQNESYVDVVKQTGENHTNTEIQSLKDACLEEEIIVEKRDTSYDTLIVLGIFAVIIGGGVALVALSRKK